MQGIFLKSCTYRILWSTKTLLLVTQSVHILLVLFQNGCYSGVHICTRYLLKSRLPFSPNFLPRAVSSASKDLPSYDTTKGHLVYEGRLTKQVKYVKGITISTSVMGILAQPLVLPSVALLPVFAQAFIGGSFTLFIIGNPLLFQLLTKRYITSLYYDGTNEVFTAHTLSFFLQKKTEKFQAEDVEVPDIPIPFTTFKVNNKPFFVDQTSFIQPHIFKKLMGFDKPLDLSDLMNDKKQ